MQRPLSVSQSLHSPHCLYIVLLQVNLTSFSASEVARSLSLCRLCGKLGLSITCFRFGKIPPPTSFSLARRFWVFFWCCLCLLFWEAALLVWRFWIMILRIAWRKYMIVRPFYSDYTNSVGQHCAHSFPTIDYITDTPKCISKFTNIFLDELIHKLPKMWLSHSQFYFIKLRRNRISSERWLRVPSKSFFSKWAFQNWSCKEYEIGKDSLQRYRSLSVIFSPSQQEYWGSYPERRRHQWHINLCSKHYCNWPGNNNRKPWKEGDIHYYFSRQPKLSTQAWWRRFCGETETRGGWRWSKCRVKGPKGWNLLGRIYCRQDVW